MTDTSVISFIGTIEASSDGFDIHLDAAHRPGLLGLSGFSHAHVLWWADRAASAKDRQMLVCRMPYANSNDDFGVFATRSPARPNPINMSVVAFARIDQANGRIEVPYIDALPGTPVVDIKPYFPASDRVLSADTPRWCAHWPQDYDSSADFDWEAEFR